LGTRQGSAEKLLRRFFDYEQPGKKQPILNLLHALACWGDAKARAIVGGLEAESTLEQEVVEARRPSASNIRFYGDEMTTMPGASHVESVLRGNGPIAHPQGTSFQVSARTRTSKQDHFDSLETLRSEKSRGHVLASLAGQGKRVEDCVARVANATRWVSSTELRCKDSKAGNRGANRSP
jgi:hypothetical protein